jgi:2-hydroxychromene-2-carboxylate isomerase
MTLSADVFWSFRSPYSYLATRRYRELADEFDLVLNLRPIYPLALRQPDFFERNHPNWLRYTILDASRVAHSLGIPFAMPRPDPIVQDLASLRISADQPHIHYVTRLGQAASQRGRGLEFADEVSRLIWGGTEGWNEPAHLTGAAARAGLDLIELDAAVTSEADALDAEINASLSALEAAGHWGVPTLVFDCEPFFGQDRIELAVWRMKQKGLRRR